MRAALRRTALVSWLLVACQKSEAPKLEPPAAPLPSASEDRVAAAVANVLTGVHSRISLAAPAWEAQPLAFGKKLFAVLGSDSVEVFSLPKFDAAMKRPLPGARGVLAIAGGSVVAVGEKEALRIDPGAKAPVRLPPVPWLPGTLLLPERRDSSLLWSVQTVGRVVLRQRLDLDPSRSFDKDITLEGYAGGAITSLRDGRLFYAAGDGVRVALPESRPKAFTTELRPWRLLPGRRVDQAWAIAEDGRVELWQLGERIAVQGRFAAGAPPFAAAANAEYLALVVVDERAGSPRRFRLLVHENDGTRVLERELPAGEPDTGERWAEAAVRDRLVALAEGEPFVAVGGPGSFEVLRLPEGERMIARSP